MSMKISIPKANISYKFYDLLFRQDYEDQNWVPATWITGNSYVAGDIVYDDVSTGMYYKANQDFVSWATFTDDISNKYWDLVNEKRYFDDINNHKYKNNAIIFEDIEFSNTITADVRAEHSIIRSADLNTSMRLDQIGSNDIKTLDNLQLISDTDDVTLIFYTG